MATPTPSTHSHDPRRWPGPHFPPPVAPREPHCSLQHHVRTCMLCISFHSVASLKVNLFCAVVSSVQLSRILLSQVKTWRKKDPELWPPQGRLAAQAVALGGGWS